MIFPLISQLRALYGLFPLIFHERFPIDIFIDNIPITIDIPIEQLIAPLVTIVCH